MVHQGTLKSFGVAVNAAVKLPTDGLSVIALMVEANSETGWGGRIRTYGGGSKGRRSRFMEGRSGSFRIRIFASIVRRRTPQFTEVHPGCRQGCRQAEPSLSTDIESYPEPEALALRERELPQEERVEGAHRLTLHVRTDMRVDVERDGDTCVAQHL